MDLRIDFPFSHRYEIETDVWLPPGHGGELVYYFPGHLTGRDGLLIRVIPQDADPWRGMFAGGGSHQSRILSFPDERAFGVVCQGSGVVVRADDPTWWEEIPCYIIRDVRVIAERSLIVFADDSHLVAYGPQGVAWQSERVALDSLEIKEVNSEEIRGTAWDDPDYGPVEFRVSLQDGLTRVSAFKDKRPRWKMW